MSSHLSLVGSGHVIIKISCDNFSSREGMHVCMVCTITYLLYSDTPWWPSHISDEIDRGDNEFGDVVSEGRRGLSLVRHGSQEEYVCY